MPRPPLPIGTYGKITCYEVAPKKWRAFTKFRDSDGVTRRVSRNGKTSAAAKRALKQALAERTAPEHGAISARSRFRDAAEQWFTLVHTAAEQGNRSPSTVTVYRSQLDKHILPALGNLRLQEVTVPRVESFLATIRTKRGASTAKTVRTVISGVLGLAVRHGAILANPTRETSRLEGGQKKAPRALTLEERKQWLAQLEADKKACRWDLPALSRFMLATGVRVGEALAVTWHDVDLALGIVEVNFTVVRVKGQGLMRTSTKTASGERTLELPTWAVAMLKQRYEAAGGGDAPVFPDSQGGLRDPSNVMKVLRQIRGTDGFAWVTSHVYRKTAATILDEAGLSARHIADQLGHSRPSMTQDVYMGRRSVSGGAADALEQAIDT